MSSLRKLDKDHALAELAAVRSLIDQLADDDYFTRISLESRATDLQEEVASFGDIDTRVGASAALFFGGRPVLGTRGIEAEFAGQAVSKFQDLVSKMYALNFVGLGTRGVVPQKAASALHITNVVRGSFGFLLEEESNSLLETPLNAAVEDTTKLLAALGQNDEEEFRTAVESIDARVLATAKEFFSLMDESAATLRLVTSDFEQQFGSDAVVRALERASTTAVEDTREIVIGQLAGVLPEAHQFEFRSLDGRGTIRGRVDRSLTTQELINFNSTWVNRTSQAEMMVRRVVENGTVVRLSYTLLSIQAPPQLSTQLTISQGR